MVTREFPHKSEGEVLSAYRLHIRLKYRGVLVRADRLRSTRLCNSGTHRSLQHRQSVHGRVSHINFERNEEGIRPDTARFGGIPTSNRENTA